MAPMVRFDRDRLMEELCQFFERETGMYSSDPRMIPIELRVPVRPGSSPARRNA